MSRKKFEEPQDKTLGPNGLTVELSYEDPLIALLTETPAQENTSEKTLRSIASELHRFPNNENIHLHSQRISWDNQRIFGPLRLTKASTGNADSEDP